MKAPNCSECGMQMVQQFGISGSQTGYHWRCQVVHRRPGFGSPPDLVRSESAFWRELSIFRNQLRIKINQHPLRHFVLRIGEKLADWLNEAAVRLFRLIVAALGLALGLGLLFLIYTMLTANIIISLVVVGIVVAIVAVLAFLYLWVQT